MSCDKNLKAFVRLAMLSSDSDDSSDLDDDDDLEQRLIAGSRTKIAAYKQTLDEPLKEEVGENDAGSSKKTEKYPSSSPEEKPKFQPRAPVSEQLPHICKTEPVENTAVTKVSANKHSKEMFEPPVDTFQDETAGKQMDAASLRSIVSSIPKDDDRLEDSIPDLNDQLCGEELTSSVPNLVISTKADDFHGINVINTTSPTEPSTEQYESNLDDLLDFEPHVDLQKSVHQSVSGYAQYTSINCLYQFQSQYVF